MISFVVPGEPAAKGRPRMTRGGRVYTPKKTVSAENMVRVYATQAMVGQPLLEGPLTVEIIAVLSIPRSWSKKRKDLAANHSLLPIKTPDIDNLAKLVTDAMNGVVYHDDKQITTLRATKIFGEAPGTAVVVDEAPTVPARAYEWVAHTNVPARLRAGWTIGKNGSGTDCHHHRYAVLMWSQPGRGVLA